MGVGSERELQALDVSKSGAEEVLLLVGKVCVGTDDDLQHQEHLLCGTLPVTFLSRLFLDLMLVASFNNIKQVQSSKSHQFLTIIGIVRSFPIRPFGFLLRKEKTSFGEARANFPTPGPGNVWTISKQGSY